ncbi:MAG: undecaprenyl-phosphate glucose phosphotransferase [Actinobacteria bacterium]|nr:undecaprenyl-phosphate glucose phosphotransferase [Actinomycetota bacterium]
MLTAANRFFTSHRFSHFSLIIGDFLGVFAGYRLAFAIYFQMGVWYVSIAPGTEQPSIGFYMAITLVILPVYWILFKLHGLYRFRLNLSVLEIFPPIFSAATEASMLLMTLAVITFPPTHYSRNVILLSWLCVIASISAIRFVIYQLHNLGRRHGWYVKNTLVLGAGKVGLTCANKLLKNPALGLRFVGFLDEMPSQQAQQMGSFHVFDDYSKLEELIRKFHIQHMVVAFSRDKHDQIVDLIERCRPYGVEFTMVPRLYEIFSDRVGVEHIRGLPVIGLKRGSITGLQALAKRTMDIIISLLTLMALSPLILLTILAIKIDSPGPVLYRQVRLGKKGRPFSILKFRSMRRDAEKKGGAGWTIPGDIRRTRVGRVIRPLGIDELPQLINVIKGEMSLVGPRPERPEHVETFIKSIPSYDARHRVRPGLTGWAQINGLRGDTDISERVEHDLYYIENWNPWLDIKIMLKTLFAFVDRDA